MSAHIGPRMSAYIDRELPASERAGVEAHLRECAVCARSVEELRAVDALARGHEVTAPAGYFEELPTRLRTRLVPPARARVPAWTLALAAGLAVAVLAPIVMRDRPAPGPAARQEIASSVPPAAAPPAEVTAPQPAPTTPAPSLFAPAPAAPRAQPVDRLARRERADAAAAGAPRAPGPPPTLEAEAAMEATPGLAGGAPARERREAARQLVVGRGAEPTAGALAGEAAAAPEAAEPEDEEEDAPPLVDDSATERDAAGQPAVPPAGRSPAAKARPGAEEHFRSLSTRAARNAAEARALRDGWQALVRGDPEGPYADDARVHALEAGAAAWRLGGLREDRAQVERDARDYLRRPQGAHKERVRALLAGLEP